MNAQSNTQTINQLIDEPFSQPIDCLVSQSAANSPHSDSASPTKGEGGVNDPGNHVVKHLQILLFSRTFIQADIQTDIQTDRQSDRHSDRQTD